MSFDPEITSSLGQIAAGTAFVYALTGGAGAAYEKWRQDFTDIDVEQSLETYQKLVEKDLEDQKVSDIALAVFNLGRIEVLENELGIEPMYGQNAEPCRYQPRALAYFDELPYDLE